jgi:GNAT superfamily N-acetyltransferase
MFWDDFPTAPEIRCDCGGEMAQQARLFCDVGLAGRIERAESELISALARATHARTGAGDGFVDGIGGGVASFAEVDSPFNKVAGVGFGGVPGAGEWAAVEVAFAERGAATQVELAHLAQSEIAPLLSDRGYRLEGYENVLGFDLRDVPELVMPSGIEVRCSGAEEFDDWLAVVVEGSVHPDTDGLPWHDEFPRAVIENAQRDSAAAGVMRYVALRDGVFAGGAELRVGGRVAQFAGAATAPEHRRRGVQTALLSARLVDAAAADCEVAVITTQPGSKSQQNAQRRGFDLLYTRAILVKRQTPAESIDGQAPQPQR